MSAKVHHTPVHHAVNNNLPDHRAAVKTAQTEPAKAAENPAGRISELRMQAAHRKSALTALKATGTNATGTTAAANVKPAVPLADRRAETAYDGKLIGAGGNAYESNTPLDQIPAIMPEKSAGTMPEKSTATMPRVIYINGVNTDKKTQYENMQVIANAAHAPVIGIHNSTGTDSDLTNNPVALANRATQQHPDDDPINIINDNAGSRLVRDVVQCGWDKIDVGKNPAHDTLTNTIVGELQQGRPLHLMAHSHGGIITARSLNQAKAILVKNETVEQRTKLSPLLKTVPPEEQQRMLQEIDRKAEEKVQGMMSNIKVETFGAASGAYPDGPQYVHYINDADNVATKLGLGGGKDTYDNWRAGKNAVIRHFNATFPSINPFHEFVAPHAIDNCYISYRIPFAQAQKEGSGFMDSPVRPFERAGYQINPENYSDDDRTLQDFNALVDPIEKAIRKGAGAAWDFIKELVK